MYKVIPYECLLVKQKACLFEEGIHIEQLYYEQRYYTGRAVYQIKYISKHIFDVELKSGQFQALNDMRVIKKV